MSLKQLTDLGYETDAKFDNMSFLKMSFKGEVCRKIHGAVGGKPIVNQVQ